MGRHERPPCGRSSSGPNSSNATVGPLAAGWFTYRRIRFFRRQTRIVALFPRLRPLQPDLGSPQHLPQGLQGDAVHDTLLQRVVAQFRERPASERLAQEVGRAEGRLDEEAPLLVGELHRPAPAVLGRERGESVGVERLDERPHVPGREVQPPGDVRRFGPLGRSEDDLGAADLDPVPVAADDLLESSAFDRGNLSNVKAHGASPHDRRAPSPTRGSPYNIRSCIAQVLFAEKVTLPFWKRH